MLRRNLTVAMLPLLVAAIAFPISSCGAVLRNLIISSNSVFSSYKKYELPDVTDYKCLYSLLSETYKDCWKL